MTKGPKPRPLADRFWEKVDRSAGAGGCWLWTAGRSSDGYGKFQAGTWGHPRPARAHRISWEMATGRSAEGGVVLHACDTPLCVNPAHLSLGTHADNVADMVAKRRHWRHKIHDQRERASEH